MWLAPTATPSAPFWPVTMVVAPVPSRLASPIVPVLGNAPKLVQYRWAPAAPVPISGSVAVTAAFLLTAVSVAESVPVLAGANCTVTEQDLPGPRSVPVQVSVVTVNAAGPDSMTASAGACDPPVFASVNVCVAVCPVGTNPKSPGDGVKASTGLVLANAGPAAATSAAAVPMASATAMVDATRTRGPIDRIDPMVTSPDHSLSRPAAALLPSGPDLGCAPANQR